MTEVFDLGERICLGYRLQSPVPFLRYQLIFDIVKWSFGSAGLNNQVNGESLARPPRSETWVSVGGGEGAGRRPSIEYKCTFFARGRI